MEHLYKSFEVKADDHGTIGGFFSTYDRVPDSYGDVVAPGAFTDTIKKRMKSGHPYPLCWNHDLDQIIGAVDPSKIVDTETGPLMTAEFLDTPLAQEKRELVKRGIIYQFSFAYEILESGPVELEDGTKANELRKVDLFEVSIVPIPANQNAVVTEIKSEDPEMKNEEPEAKAGRRNSGKDEGTIRDAISALESGIASLRSLLEVAEPEDGEDEAKANAAAEEPEQSNPKKDALLEYIKNMSMED